jgi:hypothetical protein
MPHDSPEKGCRREILLRENYFLSVEPLSEENQGSFGPAFFRRSISSEDDDEEEEESDPAMCSFELVLFVAKAERKSPLHDGRFSRHPTTAYQSRLKEAAEVQESALFFRIDRTVYQADLIQIENIEVEIDTNEDGVSKPPCLLIQFSTCTFRVFSMDGFAADQFSLLGGVKSRIVNVVTSDGICPFPTKFAPLASPNVSSGGHTSSNEPGQKQTTAGMGSLEEKSTDGKIEKQNSTDSDSVDEFVSKTNKSRTSLQQARERLETLQKVLALPVTSVAGSTADLQEQMSELLTSVPESVAASYCTRLQISRALHAHNSKIKKYHSELHDISKAFIPSARARKRSRHSNNIEENRVPPMTTTCKQPPAEVCISKTKELLRKHKEALRAKYALALLPSRG